MCNNETISEKCTLYAGYKKKGGGGNKIVFYTQKYLLFPYDTAFCQESLGFTYVSKM